MLGSNNVIQNINIHVLSVLSKRSFRVFKVIDFIRTLNNCYKNINKLLVIVLLKLLEKKILFYGNINYVLFSMIFCNGCIGDFYAIVIKIPDKNDLGEVRFF